MALRKEKLEGYRKLLNDRRELISAGLRRTTQELVDDEPMYTDSVDQASAEADKTLALQIKFHERGILNQIDEALRRLEDGNFGECERCDEPIAEARIRAFPFTTLCIDCKTELESEEQRFPGRA